MVGSNEAQGDVVQWTPFSQPDITSVKKFLVLDVVTNIIANDQKLS